MCRPIYLLKIEHKIELIFDYSDDLCYTDSINK